MFLMCHGFSFIIAVTPPPMQKIRLYAMYKTCGVRIPEMPLLFKKPTAVWFPPMRWNEQRFFFSFNVRKTVNIHLNCHPVIPFIFYFNTLMLLREYITLHYFYCLFNLILHGRVPASPLTPYNINFVQHGFTERATFEERNLPLSKRVYCTEKRDITEHCHRETSCL
jgi:hypothetical protein